MFRTIQYRHAGMAVPAVRAVGFTGTQVGMKQPQITAFVALMRELNPMEFHHGDCIGADEDAHLLVRENFPNVAITIHPPKDYSKRAFMLANIERAPKEYLQRNRWIVISSDVLIATPKQMEEVARSGTWSTVRFAKEIKKPVYVIYPDGKIERHTPV